MSIENFGRVLISYINIYKKQNYLNDLKNIASQFKNEEVTIDQFVSFFIFLDFLQEELKHKLYSDKSKIIKLEDIMHIEKKFRKSNRNSSFNICVNKKQIEFMFKLLDTDRIIKI